VVGLYTGGLIFGGAYSRRFTVCYCIHYGSLFYILVIVYSKKMLFNLLFEGAIAVYFIKFCF
jgi:hypothetical protein